MKKFWQWIKDEVLVRDMFVFVLIAIVIFYIPAWVAIIVGFTLQNEYIYGFAGMYVLVWAGPFTPTIPAIMGIAVFFKQLYKKITRKSDDDETV